MPTFKRLKIKHPKQKKLFLKVMATFILRLKSNLSLDPGRLKLDPRFFHVLKRIYGNKKI
tara:strand:+ start:76 stop:255 length:180 start_codon:yes stop_codon:yes gene_type:complete